MRLLSVPLPQLLSRQMTPPLEALMHPVRAPQRHQAARMASAALRRQMRAWAQRELSAQWALALLKQRIP